MGDVVAAGKVWENVPIPRTQRTRKILRYTAGKVVPEAVAKKLNVGADGLQAKVPTAKVDGSGVVPLTQASPAQKAKAAAKKTSRARKRT